MIQLAMVEDDPWFRESVHAALASSADIALAAEATDLREALELLSGPPADVLLVDLGLPDGSGLDMIQATVQAWPGCPVMVSTLFSDEERVFASLAAGASGYLLKDEKAEGIVEGIRSLHAGGSPISPFIARRLLRHFQQPASPTVESAELSLRELQVLEQITRGYATAEIANTLGVSHWTVQTYVRRIYEKLGVRSRAGAVGEAYRLGLVART